MKMNREFKFRYLMNDVRHYLLKEKGFFDSIEYTYIRPNLMIDIHDVNGKKYHLKLNYYDMYDVENKDFVWKMAEIILFKYEQEYFFQLLGGVRNNESKR